MLLFYLQNRTTPCATGGFGASSLKIKSLDLCYVTERPKLSTLQPLHGSRTPKFARFDGLVLSHRPRNEIIGCRSSVSGAESNANTEDDSKQTESTNATSSLIPNALEVEHLLTELCDTTSIAELELKLGGFRLYVSRDLTKQKEPPVHAPVTHTVVETPPSNGFASSPSLALVRPRSSDDIKTLLDKATDEGLAILKSTTVGIFRRSKTIKGKKYPPPCKEKDNVKEGKVLCYIEQLGSQLPIQSEIAGEVVKILKKDGDPVGYGDALIAILPSFPGIKKLQ
ncbi:Single hybrid motif superfamily protein [Striga hermonthica]|uniref:Single hybrid motif superfamily protein n=1 Tax=Striga hermonthica TaxID=68872 RepID=A0A9N7RPK1_STRHE|nr:Single hybrid motif superfamily protein [Striga hermonthica]